MLKFEKILRLTKVDEATHTAYGILTGETVDCANEKCSYAATKPLYQAWSQETLASTTAAGQDASLGNVRLQHGMEIAGKLTAIDYDDTAKTISVAAQPIDDRIWKMIKGGFVTGFSQGGKYVWRKCDECGTAIKTNDNYCPSCEKNVVVLYSAKPVECSLVDLPCLPEARFAYVKADGSTELRKFNPKEKEVSLDKSVKYLVHGADGQMHLPYTDEDGKPSHRLMGAAWAALHGGYRGNKYSGPGKDKAIERLKQIYAGENMDTPAAKAEKWKSDAAERVKSKLAGSKVNKGMYQLANFAGLLDSLYWLRMSAEWERETEGDESTVPEQLQEDLDNLIETYIAMVAEETSEMSANDKAAKTNKGDSTMTEQEVNLLKAARKSMASHFGKMAKMHKSMAMNHEAMGKCEMGKHAACKDMMEACKADVGTEANPGDTGASPMWADHMTKMCKSMMDEHKGMAMGHEKMAKGHHMAAEHMDKMAAAHMEDDGEKALTALDGVAKAEFSIDVEKPEVAKAPASVASLHEEELALARKAFWSSDAGKEAVSRMVQAEVAEIMGKTIVPDGVKLPGAPGLTVVPRHGQVEKSGNANQGTSWSGDLSDCGFGAN